MTSETIKTMKNNECPKCKNDQCVCNNVCPECNNVDCTCNQIRYTEKELVEFGNYLLSDRRKETISKKARQSVHNADLMNFKDYIQK